MAARGDLHPVLRTAINPMESSLLLQKFTAEIPDGQADLQLEVPKQPQVQAAALQSLVVEKHRSEQVHRTSLELPQRTTVLESPRGARSEQVTQQLEVQKTALETLMKEHRSEASTASNEAQQRHEQLLGELRRLAPARALKPLGDAPSSKERSATCALESLVKKLEQQYIRTEELHERVLGDLEGATEKRVGDRLEILYARHEARLETLLVQNEKTMEEWMKQVRQVAHKTGMRLTGSSIDSKPLLRQDPATYTPVKIPTAEERVIAMASKKRNQHCSLDVAALSAVQGWKSLSTNGYGKRVSKLTKSKPSSCPECPHLRRFLTATLETVSSVVVILNLVFMGIDADVSLRSSRGGGEPPGWLWVMGALFLILLLAEIAARVCVEQWAFVSGPNRRWNLFDCVLAAVQIFDTVLVFYNASFLRTLRIVRALRVTRAFRTMRSVRELRIMIASIHNSVASLFWAFLLLFFALYTVSLVLVQSVVSHIQTKGIDNVQERVLKYYGSMSESMLSLFMAVSGGQAWGEIVEPLEDISKLYRYGFVCFITVTVFGMMNVLTAIFVDSTSKMSNLDRERVIQEHLDVKNSTAAQLRHLLLEADMDSDKSGTISKKEFLMKMSDPRFTAQLGALELEVHEAQGLFEILNYEDSKDVPIEEFIYGLMRMKGTAKGVDMVTMLSENRRILAKLLAFMEFMDDSLQDLKVGLHIPGDTCLQDYLELG